MEGVQGLPFKAIGLGAGVEAGVGVTACMADVLQKEVGKEVLRVS